MSAPYEEVSPRHRRCGFCGREAISRKGLADHIRMKHGEIPRVEHFLKVPHSNQPTWPFVPPFTASQREQG